MKKTLFFSALVVLMAGMIFAGCKKDSDKDEPGQTDVTVNANDDYLAGLFFYTSERFDGGVGTEIGFTADHKAVIDVRGEATATLTWSIDENRNITLKFDTQEGTDEFGEVESATIDALGNELTLNFKYISSSTGVATRYSLTLERAGTKKYGDRLNLVGNTWKGGINGSSEELKVNIFSETGNILFNGKKMNFKYELSGYWGENIRFYDFEGDVDYFNMEAEGNVNTYFTWWERDLIPETATQSITGKVMGEKFAVGR